MVILWEVTTHDLLVVAETWQQSRSLMQARHFKPDC